MDRDESIFPLTRDKEGRLVAKTVGPDGVEIHVHALSAEDIDKLMAEGNPSVAAILEGLRRKSDGS